MGIRPVVALLALALAACADAPAPKVEAPAARSPAPAEAIGHSLAGTRWIGVVAGNPDPRTLPRLEFVNSERVTGYTGCNMLNGGWHVEGATIRVGPLVTTKRACAGPENDIERRLLATIGGVVTREGDRLVFTGANGERFEFMPAAAS